MYENLFGFKRRPFVSVPDVELYYPGETIEAARQTLIRGIERGEGPGLLLGPSGTGKTLLCKLLALHFERRVPVALLCAGRFGTRGDLLRTILYELGQPYRDLDEGEARITLVDYLTSSEDSPHTVVVLVDEAHTLPLKLLDELRMLGNLCSGIAPAVRMVLAGGMTLEEHLAHPKLECLSQRISTRCYLESLDGCETSAYISSQIDAVRRPSGRLNDDLFGEKPARAVYQATDGVPRLINQVSDRALLAAYNRGKSVVATTDVEEAWAELQQLPSPWNDEPAESSGVIEFGSLDDDECDLKPASEAVSEPEDAPRLQILRESRENKVSEPEHVPASLEVIPEAEPFTSFAASEKARSATATPYAASGTPAVRALNPFSEAFEDEEVVVPRPAPRSVVGRLLAGDFEAGPPAATIAVAELSREEETEALESPSKEILIKDADEDAGEADSGPSSETIRVARPVSVAFDPGFPLPEFSWPDPQYGYSPLPRERSVQGPVPGSTAPGSPGPGSGGMRRRG